MIIPNLLTQELIHELQAAKETPCISLFMPTHRTHPDNIQDIIRYENLVRQVKASLLKNYPTAEIKKLLEPLDTLANDTEFWKQSSSGLGILRSGEFFKVIRLQTLVEELVIVADGFHTKPLRQFLQSADRYQVLTITMDAVRFFEGNRHTLIETELPDDFPKTITDALGEELTEKHLTVASFGGVGGKSGNMHHGHGGKKDQVDDDTKRFFRIAAGAVYDHYSQPSGLPLLLAALPEHHYHFNLVNKNPFVLPKGIEINPQSVSTERLAELSWEAMQPVYLKKLEKLAENFFQAKADGVGSDNIEEVIDAAVAGRVETLFIEENRIIAKRLRNINGTFKVMDVTQPKLDDLLDDIGELVSKKGGNIFFLPKDIMPGKTGLAAILRY